MLAPLCSPLCWEKTFLTTSLFILLGMMEEEKESEYHTSHQTPSITNECLPLSGMKIKIFLILFIDVSETFILFFQGAEPFKDFTIFIQTLVTI